ncbi:MAG: LCP family protein [Actinomycetota bacterium]|nr:LCP family protein [Actinomycetota bacterium]
MTVRRRRGSAVIWAVALTAVLVAIPAVGVAWIQSSIDRDAGVTAELRSPGRGQGRTFLVVGNDSRERIRADAGDRFGRTDTLTDQRADAIMLVQLPRRGGGPVRVLSLPRDLRVDGAGFGPQKLSWVLGYAGRPALVRTVRELTGVPVQHYVEMDFVGFAAAVDAAGGVTLDFPRPGRDATTGFEVTAGHHRLDGTAALAYARSRTYEELDESGWALVDDGDGGRIQRQHALVRAALGQRGSSTRPSVVDRLRWLRRVGHHLTVDSGLSAVDLVRLAGALAALRPDQLELATLPTRALVPQSERVSPFPPYHLGGVAYEVPVEPAASEAIGAFLRGSEAR